MRDEEYEMRNEMVRRKQHLYIEPPSGNDRANFRTKGDKTMTKTRMKFRITGVLLTLAMLLATLSSFAIPAFAAEEDGSTDVIDASAMTADELQAAVTERLNAGHTAIITGAVAEKCYRVVGACCYSHNIFPILYVALTVVVMTCAEHTSVFAHGNRV